MKTKQLRSTRCALVAGFALSTATLAVAQYNAPQFTTTTAPATVQVATPEMQSFALNAIAGRPLRTINGEELGQVTDYLIDPQTGAIHFALVPSGGGAEGSTFRVVPIGALDTSSPERLTVKIGQSQWDRVGTMLDQRLQGRIVLNSEQRERLGREFSMNGTPSDNVAEFVRASQLRGQPVQSTNAQLATVDDVLIDLRHRTAAAVVTPASVSGAQVTQKFLLPFTQLEFGTGARPAITTMLAPTVFQQLPPQPPASYSPTGYTSAPFTTVSQTQPVSAAASAVQQAIARDRAAAGVQVVPESRLVLRGTVENQQKKIEIERAAIQAAPGVPIDNQLTVRNW